MPDQTRASTISSIACEKRVKLRARPALSVSLHATTVNVVVTVTCTAVVREIAVQAALYRQNPADGLWYLQAASDVKRYYDTTFGDNNAAAPCQDGNWVGWMNYNVVFMSGFSGGDSGFGNQVAITCSA
jgi:hypothetical protein